jgi:hypothetical protein
MSVARSAIVTVKTVNDDLESGGAVFPVEWSITFDPPFTSAEEEDSSVVAIIAFEMMRHVKPEAGTEGGPV